MSQLLLAPNEYRQQLKERASRCCIAFAEEPLPPGTSQPTARVGVEVNPTTGQTWLHVDRNIAYTGSSPEVEEWLSTGSKTFEDFEQLQAWLDGPLAMAYHGMPDTDSITTTPERLLFDKARMESVLKNKIIGQDSSVETIVSAIALQLARTAPRRPLTALALGPTGVGKTLLAESLAAAINEVTGTTCTYLRLDMTEFQESHSVSRLFGAPPGYVGYGQEPQLMKTLRSGERAVILVDEIEKAHPDVFLAMMNLMDAGRITPASGPTIDARQAILIFTTNLGSAEVKTALAKRRAADIDNVVKDSIVRQTLRDHNVVPELVGRLNTLLVFNDLGDHHINEILRRSVTREAATFDLEVSSIDDQVISVLQEHRPDPGSGVRAWEQHVANTLGNCFLEACRRSLTGNVAIHANPIRIEPISQGNRRPSSNSRA